MKFTGLDKYLRMEREAARFAPQGVEQSVDYDIDERGHRIWGSEKSRG